MNNAKLAPLEQPAENPACSSGIDQIQIVDLIQLTEIQIEKALKEGDTNIKDLSEFFASFSNAIMKIASHLLEPESQPSAASNRQAISALCRSAQSDIKNAIISLQFHDKQVQRLGHAKNALSTLTSLLTTHNLSEGDLPWDVIWHEVRSVYSTADEQRIHNEFIATKPELAAYVCAADGSTDSSDDGIELF